MIHKQWCILNWGMLPYTTAPHWLDTWSCHACISSCDDPATEIKGSLNLVLGLWALQWNWELEGVSLGHVFFLMSPHVNLHISSDLLIIMPEHALPHILHVCLDLLTKAWAPLFLDLLELMMGEMLEFVTMNNPLPFCKSRSIAKVFNSSLKADDCMQCVSADLDLAQKPTQSQRSITKFVKEPHICSCL